VQMPLLPVSLARLLQLLLAEMCRFGRAVFEREPVTMPHDDEPCELGCGRASALPHVRKALQLVTLSTPHHALLDCIIRAPSGLHRAEGPVTGHGAHLSHLITLGNRCAPPACFEAHAHTLAMPLPAQFPFALCLLFPWARAFLFS
jgi:hypothetical protein